MKHYIDIQRARFEDEGLTKVNTGAFEVGDHINISIKIDGTNAAIAYEDGQLKAFSRKRELDMSNTNRGFWNFVQKLSPNDFADLGKMICFGEFLVSHTVKYYPESYNQFYVFDMYDTETGKWLSQTRVKAFAESHGLNYVMAVYDGEFISWEHVKSFLNTKAPYGDTNEGVVVKNQSKLDLADDDHNPAYIKIVNAQFKETKIKNHIRKVLDPYHIEQKALADEHANELVTEARVRKEINKMIDEGLLPETLAPKNMADIARLLPKRIYADIDKEDHDTLIVYSDEYLGKSIGNVVMNYARKIVIG